MTFDILPPGVPPGSTQNDQFGVNFAPFVDLLVDVLVILGLFFEGPKGTWVARLAQMVPVVPEFADSDRFRPIQTDSNRPCVHYRPSPSDRLDLLHSLILHDLSAKIKQ